MILLACSLLLGATLTTPVYADGNFYQYFPGLVASRFVSDPARHRIYASLTATNEVAVIDTNPISVTTKVPIGLAPVGMAMSPDGLSLYVALSGTGRVAVLDLTTLTTLQPLFVDIKPWQVAAGLGNRLYITPLEDVDGLLQVDAMTGATQGVMQVATSKPQNQTFKPGGNDQDQHHHQQ